LGAKFKTAKTPVQNPGAPFGAKFKNSQSFQFTPKSANTVATFGF